MARYVREVKGRYYGTFGTPSLRQNGTPSERSKYSFRWEEIYSVFDKDSIYLIPRNIAVINGKFCLREQYKGWALDGVAKFCFTKFIV